MVVLSEKDLGLVPPPPYFAIEHGHDLAVPKSSSSLSRSPSSVHLPHSSSSSHPSPRTAPTLPSHILLLIVYSTLPRAGEYRLDRVSGTRVRESAEEMAVRTTRTLYWMAFCLRAVNRGFYLAAMHILRSTFLPHYVQRVRPPYSSDPFPHTSLSSHHSSDPSSTRSGSDGGSRSLTFVVSSVQCESEVLDLYILHQLHEDVFADDSSLHTARTDTLRDLFDFMQPRARLADLVRSYGAGAGLVALTDSEMLSEADAVDDEGELNNASAGQSSSSANRGPGLSLKAKLARSTSALTLTNPLPPSSIPCPSPSASQAKIYTYTPHPPRASGEHSRRNAPTQMRKKIPYSSLRIAFSPRRVGLIYTAPGSGGSVGIAGPRTIVDIARAREESLERTASRLIAGLKTWLDGVVTC